MSKYEYVKFLKKISKSNKNLDAELRTFLDEYVPKKVLFALTVSHEGEVTEGIVSLKRRVEIGKRHWMYAEFIEHNGFMLPRWYVTAKLECDAC